MGKTWTKVYEVWRADDGSYRTEFGPGLREKKDFSDAWELAEGLAEMSDILRGEAQSHIGMDIDGVVRARVDIGKGEQVWISGLALDRVMRLK